MSASRALGVLVREWLLAAGQDALRQRHWPTFDNQPFGARPERGQCDKKLRRDEMTFVNFITNVIQEFPVVYGNVISK